MKEFIKSFYLGNYELILTPSEFQEKDVYSCNKGNKHTGSKDSSPNLGDRRPYLCGLGR